MDIIQTSCLQVNKQDLTSSQKEELLNVLTFNQQDYMSGEQVTNYFFKEDEGHIYAPRFLFNYYEPDMKYTLIPDTRKADKISITDTITLRSDIQKLAVKSLIDNKNGIIKLPPGKGKTVIAIKYIATRKLKTIIYVDTEKLREQWIDRITAFTNLTKEDIGIIQADKLELDKPIILAMIQTVSNRAKTDFQGIKALLDSANIGITIFDEVHVMVGPEHFTSAAFVTNSIYMFGLSATPSRTDGRDKLLKYCIGDIIYENSEYDMDPLVNIVYFDSGIAKSKSNSWINWDGKFIKFRYLNILKKNNTFKQQLGTIITTCKSKNRKMVIICDLKEMLLSTIDYLKESKILNESDIGYFVAGSEDAERTKNFVFTTYKLTGKGIDYPQWDTMLFLSPMSSLVQLEQTIGRVTRSFPGKPTPVIFDLVDMTYPILRGWAKRRNAFYKQRNFEVNDVSRK